MEVIVPAYGSSIGPVSLVCLFGFYCGLVVPLVNVCLGLADTRVMAVSLRTKLCFDSFVSSLSLIQLIETGIYIPKTEPVQSKMTCFQ